jgi:hypothetical protein
MDLPIPSHLPAAAITTIIRRFEHLSTVTMHDVLGKMPYPWQLEILSHLSLMKKIDTSIYPGAVLLVRPTGGGKSSVWDVYSVMCAGVSLTITPLLSLGVDQTQEIQQNTSTNGGPVHAYHLDEFGVHKHSNCIPIDFFRSRSTPTPLSSSFPLHKRSSTVKYGVL